MRQSFPHQTLKRLILLLGALAFISFSHASRAGLDKTETITLAVASNFAHTLAKLAPLFEAQHPYRLRISIGSTGKHYAQIQHGAPYDVFLAADRDTPAKLSVSLKQQSFHYTTGQLALWSPTSQKTPNLAPIQSATRVAIANPKLAPYGKAAEHFLHNSGIQSPNLVMGENINQAFQFVASGNASIGLVALSQVHDKPQHQIWVIPAHSYPSIEQHGILLNQRPGSIAFKRFILSDHAQRLIQQQGYLPLP